MRDKLAQMLKKHQREISFIKALPRDDIDWALIIYLLRHHHRSIVWPMGINPSNAISVNKIALFFGLELKDVNVRLSRMCFLVHKFVIYGYHNPITVYRLKEDVLEKLIFPLLEPCR